MTDPIAQTIIDQIGHKAFCMMGTNHIVTNGRRIQFNVRGHAKVKKIAVEMVGDLYTVVFYNNRGMVLHESEMIDANQLHHCIETNTGLRLSL